MDLTAHFRGQLAVLLPSAVAKVAVAVSGGPDSLALALLLKDWCLPRKVGLLALVVDHGLRPESQTEAALVAERLEALSIEAEILCWSGADKPATGLMEAARAARYALLLATCRSRGIQHLFLGHQQDDQAETVLLRLARQSGWRGLAGMPWLSWRENVALVRPLLAVPKAALVAYCRERGAVWVDDPSNVNPRYTRARLRGRMGEMAELGFSGAAIAASAEVWRAKRQAELTVFAGLGVAVHEAGYATVLHSAFLQLEPQQREGLLVLLLRTVGQAAYVPESAALARVLAHLGEPNFAAITLAGCRVLWQRGQLLVAREAGAVRVGSGPYWDRRFLLAAAGAGQQLVALGERPWKKLAPDLALLPGVVRAALPVLEEKGEIVSIPPRFWCPQQQPFKDIFDTKSAG